MVIQSCHLDGKSFCGIGRSIVSERGLNGLYRGIASNIASSAPVSAIYTFTYETVKGVLLPLLPKSYPLMTDFLKSGLYKWAGDANLYDKDGPYIELVTSPNNPDGVVRTSVVNRDKGIPMHDFA